jgi:hypothetical protein
VWQPSYRWKPVRIRPEVRSGRTSRLERGRVVFQKDDDLDGLPVLKPAGPGR